MASRCSTAHMVNMTDDQFHMLTDRDLELLKAYNTNRAIHGVDPLNDKILKILKDEEEYLRRWALKPCSVKSPGHRCPRSREQVRREFSEDLSKCPQLLRYILEALDAETPSVDATSSVESVVETSSVESVVATSSAESEVATPSMCVVCLDNRATHGFACKGVFHVCVCETCGPRLDSKCPMCRNESSILLKVC